jgi:hypothetical protein
MNSQENPYQSPQPIDNPRFQGRSVRPYVSGRPRALGVVSLLAVMGVILLVILVLDIVVLYTGLCILHGTPEQFQSAKRISALLQPIAHWISVPLVMAYLAASVAFLMWIHRVHRNLPSLLASPLRYSPGWAVGYYFIPILNLIRPYQVMREILRGSDPAQVAPLRNPSHKTKMPSSAIVGWWWASFLLMQVANQAGRPFRDLMLSNPFVPIGISMACVLITLAAAILTIVLVLRVDARQSRRYAILLELPVAAGVLPSGTTGDALLH